MVAPLGDATTIPTAFSDLSNKLSNGATWVYGQTSEHIILNTVVNITDSFANLLPANSVIDAVVSLVTENIVGSTSVTLGDKIVAGRFCMLNTGLTSGTKFVGLNHLQSSVTTDEAGPVQIVADKLRVTTTGIPSSGVISVTIFYRQYIAPTL